MAYRNSFFILIKKLGISPLVNYKFLDFSKQLAKTNDNNKKVFLYLFF